MLKQPFSMTMWSVLTIVASCTSSVGQQSPSNVDVWPMNICC
jgi:hypothetical protein